MGPGGIGGRQGRSGEAGGRGHTRGVGEEQRVIALPTLPRETGEIPGQSPALQGRPPGHLGPGGHRMEAEGKTREAGGRGPLVGAGEEQRIIAPPTRAQGAC